MDMPYADVDRIAKMVPTTLNIKLEEAIEESPQLQRGRSKGPQVRELIDDRAASWKAWCATAGVHAAGVVISPAPAHRPGPALQRTKNDEIVTAVRHGAPSKSWGC